MRRGSASAPEVTKADGAAVSAQLVVTENVDSGAIIVGKPMSIARRRHEMGIVERHESVPLRHRSQEVIRKVIDDLAHTVASPDEHDPGAHREGVRAGDNR